MNKVEFEQVDLDHMLFKSLKEVTFFNLSNTFRMFKKRSESFNFVTLDGDRYLLVCESMDKINNYVINHDTFHSILGSKIVNIEEEERYIQTTFEYSIIIHDIIFNTERGNVKISWNIKRMETERENGIRLYKIL